MNVLDPFRKLINMLRDSKKNQFLELLKLDDSIASIELSKINLGFFPKSSYSLSPTTLLHVINEIIINDRSQILEIGSGISTLYLAKVIKDNNLDSTLLSLDEDEKWQQVIKENLKKIECEHLVTFKTASLKEGNYGYWYDDKIVSEFLCRKNYQFDLVLVDAPSTTVDKTARDGAIPFLTNNNLLSEEYVIFLDDTFREKEYKISLSWQERLQCKLFNYTVYSILVKGDGFITQPFFQGHKYRVNEYYKRI
ncbi:class I SAM-dependent methyltransferase [Lutimonas vermicola]|uniref:Class I SAM-dependent methyltransferase n=1 Tax=Lutimonas vermicola TaxID=414288 RepID=A0ABU9KXW4_9FLAO